MTSPIRDMFTRIAPSYDRVNDILTFSLVSRCRRKMIAEIKPCTKPCVLDLCAGTLEGTIETLRRFPDASVTTIDFCEAMLDIGLKKIPADKLSQVKIACADVLHVELPENSFDAIVCAWGVRNIQDKTLLLKNAFRWLKPGGQFIVIDFFKPTGRLHKYFFRSFGAKIVSKIGGIFAGDKNAYDYLIGSINKMLGTEEFANLLAREGFADIKFNPMLFGTNSLFVAVKGK